MEKTKKTQETKKAQVTKKDAALERDSAKEWMEDKASKEKKEKRLPLAQAHPVLWGVGMAVWVGLCLFLTQILLGFIVGILVKMGALSETALGKPVAQFIASAVVYVVSSLIAILVPKYVRKIGTNREELGLRGMPTWTDILLSPIGFIVTMLGGMLLTGVLALMLPNLDWQQTQELGFTNIVSRIEIFEAFLTLVVIAPIAEELMFRGWLYGKLRCNLGAPIAILITSLLFGIMHGQWNVGVVTFVMSVVMCLQREMTGTIYSGILTHMIKNGVAFYILFMMGRF